MSEYLSFLFFLNVFVSFIPEYDAEILVGHVFGYWNGIRVIKEGVLYEILVC